MSSNTVTVVAALIWREGELLICQRRETDLFPGKWEFPGGKLEPGETPQAALKRELFEELGLRARIGCQVAQLEHQYPDHAPVQLLFFAVREFDGVPENRVFQQFIWVRPEQLSVFDFLDADRPLIARIADREIVPPIA